MPARFPLRSIFMITRAVAIGASVVALSAFTLAPAFAQDVASLEREVAGLERQLVQLEAGHNALVFILQGVGGVLGLLLALGAIVWARGEAIAQKSISTINELYELARRTAEQAVGANLRQAKDWLNEIDARARDFMNGKGDRDFLRTHAARRTMVEISDEVRSYRRLARQFASAERDKEAMLPPELTSNCYFLLGLRENLDQGYDAAIAAWTSGAQAQAAEGKKDLIARCHYWAGMANNNLGKYPEAQTCFEQAIRELPAGNREKNSRYWVFERHRLESWYFEKHKDDVGEIERAAKDVAGRAARALGEQESGPVSLICGNILLSCAIERQLDPSRKQALLDAALAYYEKSSGIWAEFCKAQTRWLRNAAGDRDEARRIYGSVVPLTARFLTERVEERSRMLARTARFISRWRADQRDSAEAERDQILAGLADIEEYSFVYSQFVMRNVEKDEFRAQVEGFS
jgi:TolA-binding protein